MAETLLHSSIVGPTVEEPVLCALDVKEGSKTQIRGGRRGFGRYVAQRFLSQPSNRPLSSSG